LKTHPYSLLQGWHPVLRTLWFLRLLTPPAAAKVVGGFFAFLCKKGDSTFCPL